MSSIRNLTASLLAASVLLSYPTTSSATIFHYNGIGFATECEGLICNTFPISGELSFFSPEEAPTGTLILCDPSNTSPGNSTECAMRTSLFLDLVPGIPSGTGETELLFPQEVGDPRVLRINLAVSLFFGNLTGVKLDAAYCDAGCNGPFWQINGDEFFYDSGHGEQASGHIAFIPEPTTIALLGIGFAGFLGTGRVRRLVTIKEMN